MDSLVPISLKVRTRLITGGWMRGSRIRYAFILVVFFLVYLNFHRFVTFWEQPLKNEEILKVDEGQELACRHPDLDVFNPLILKHIRDLGKLDCKREEDWIEISHGKIIFNQGAVEKHGEITCSITYLVRQNEFSSIKGKTVHLVSAVGPITLEGDFFHALCYSKDEHKWDNLMAGVFRNETVVERVKSAKPPKHAIKLNVLIFGLDSMSRLHYIRKLPKTYKYVTEVLKGVVLKDYNIVGDGTPQALIPIFTGYTELELPETRKRMPNAHFVDVYPFVWKNFSASGYVTGHSEDSPSTGTFTYRLKGFKDPPTDHYTRTFYLEAEKMERLHPRLCFASKPRHVVFLNWLRHFYDAYSDVPKFLFGLHSELSHDDYNLIGYADLDIEQFLRDLNDSGVLDDTLLILMSDHGHRFASIRETQQGKLEERLPFFAFVVPQWFQQRYPDFTRNLRTNANRLVTPFDIHATLMSLLHPEDVPNEGNPASRSISLFSRISKKRTCTMAAIEPHWCACLNWVNVSAADLISSQVGQAVIDFANSMTDPQRSKCAMLYLQKVTRIEKLQPNKALLTFRKNADKDGFVGDFSDSTNLTEVLYQVQVLADPSNALYEASVKHDVAQNAFIVKEDELSRVNMYANQEHCIHDKYPYLRKYCYCKEQNWIPVTDKL